MADREPEELEPPSDAELAVQAETFRNLLMGEKAKLLKNAQRTLTEDMTLDQDDLPDEMDLATADYNQSLAFRLRGRERHLLSKIDASLERIENDEYFWCSSCSNFIGLNRLLARPVTTLCIRCKEKQERQERSFAG